MAVLLRNFRPTFGCTTISLAVAAYLLLLTNFTFWKKGLEYFSGNQGPLAAFAIWVFVLLTVGILGFSVKYFFKPYIIALILISATASYFVDTFGIVIQQNMIRDVLTTTSNEASQFFTWDLFIHISLVGILPSIVIAWIKIDHHPISRKLVHNTIFIIACLAIAGALVAFNFRLFSSVYSKHKDLLGRLNPAAPIAAVFELVRSSYSQNNIKIRPIAKDAKLGRLISKARKPVLTIIVVGESARSQNFSLNGYKRETNKELKKRNIISFPNFYSCSTTTRVSLPCIFSMFGRSDYSTKKGKSKENFLDVLQSAGVQTSWWDNNTGSYGIADRVTYEMIQQDQFPQYCPNNECNDGVFPERLKQYFGEISGNSVVVMHQIGSHGPAYYLRYPPEFEIFTPSCQTSQISDCTAGEVVNVYDNSILYTDTILAQIIDLLKSQQDKFLTAMIYTSDHGESLGEYGLYLHNTAYFLAPETQTKVPFITWFSDDYAKQMQLDLGCVKAGRERRLSHDNLFHTILGLMNVKTRVYRPKLDAFADCRG